MLITRKSPRTGIETTLDLPITQQQIQDWHDGVMIQRAFPNLSASEREFIKTGLTQADWDAIFPSEDEE